MAVSFEFPATAAKPLVEGYCQEFVALAASLAQTLEQIEMRSIDLGASLEVLTRTESSMRGLADAIRDMLDRLATTRRNRQPQEPEQKPAELPAPATASQPAAAAPDRARPDDAQHQLKGNTQVIPLASVMQFLSRVRKSGTLHVDVGEEHVTFEFVNGVIEASTSNQSIAGERLGEILLAMFPAHQERLQAALQRFEQRGNLRRLGGELVQAGVASNGQVVEALERQVHARFHRIVTAAQANYTFEEGERVPSDGRIRIRPFELEFTSRMQAR